ncbi:hypothetical protein CPB86DRAFT_516832 [Serendipita vermifera]|nr:hypothetical protein CPB86DRAFT_516832 [Serendipita vermifera]
MATPTKRSVGNIAKHSLLPLTTLLSFHILSPFPLFLTTLGSTLARLYLSFRALAGFIWLFSFYWTTPHTL